MGTRSILALGLLSSAAIAPPVGASVLTTVEAESGLGWTPSANATMYNTPASGGKAVKITQNAVGTLSNQTGRLESITITAKGDQCIGAPNMRIKIDGNVIANQRVTSTAWTDYDFPIDLPAGTHTLEVGFTNQFVWTLCTRSLHVDKVLVVESSAPQARDPLKQPFASGSIWNMPIGSGAQYVDAGLPEITASYSNDHEWTPIHYPDADLIILKPDAPLTNIYLNEVGWNGGDRCVVQGGVIHTVPIPTDFVVPNSGHNNGAAFLMPDRRTIVQTQPFTRCTAGGPATSWTTHHPTVDLYGAGIEGAHGGSGLSAIGGALRVGELRPGDTTGPRHALKINLQTQKELYRCLVDADCHRWPALTSDSGSVGWYGSETNNQNFAMRMGALLAIPASVNLGSLELETQPAQLLAWTLQNYGAYVVDHGGPSFSVEEGPDGSFSGQFQSDWGFDMEARVRDNSAWGRDLNRLRQALYVVDNNSPTTIGGGGTPLQPLAPEIHP